MKCSLLVLSSYLDRELEARREGELEAHLVGCQRCRAGLGYLREEVERVGALGRVHVADHSIHALLSQLGLIDVEEPLPESPWRPQAYDEPDVTMTGTPDPTAYAPPPMSPAFAEDAAEPAADDLPPDGLPEAGIAEEIPSDEGLEEPDRPPFRWVPTDDAVRPPFTWAPPPSSTAGAQVPPIPPPEAVHGPPAEESSPDHASSAPSGDAFPPGGPERFEPSDLPTSDPAPGGEPEMTASPPWTPRETHTGSLYPMTDEDVLGEPLPVERFGPPEQAKPSLFERLRDRIAVRRALARSSSAYEDQVQIVSGLGAPLHTGRARLEVERRRQETLRMDPGSIPGAPVGRRGGIPDTYAMSDIPDELGHTEGADDPDDDLAGLGPLPPPLPQATPMPRPPVPPRPGTLPGQMALPGTNVGDPFNPSIQDPRAPIHRTPMPPPHHTLGGALGELPAPPRVPMPPLPPLPPAMPPAMPPPPRPDPLGEALSGYDRDRAAGTGYEPRPWRPREIPEDVAPAAAAPRFAPPDTDDRRRPSPSQLRDGRRLLMIFGAATLVMFIVGIASGRTVSPPTSPTGSSSSANPAQPKAKASQPAGHTSTAPAPGPTTPQRPSVSQAPAIAAPQLTGVKVLGDGGTGYQVKDFRYGIHPGDFRIVLDLESAGAASGTPKATVGFLDSTTLYVVLDGVVPAGSTGQLPSSNPVTGVTLLQPSPFAGAITYQIKLAHPVTFGAGYVDTSAPLRLVLDING